MILIIWYVIGAFLHFLQNNPFIMWHPKSQIAMGLESIGSYLYEKISELEEKIRSYTTKK